MKRTQRMKRRIQGGREGWEIKGENRSERGGRKEEAETNEGK